MVSGVEFLVREYEGMKRGMVAPVMTFISAERILTLGGINGPCDALVAGLSAPCLLTAAALARQSRYWAGSRTAILDPSLGHFQREPVGQIR